MEELLLKIEKMRKGLENPNITGTVRESLLVAVKKAEAELAAKERADEGMESLKENIERARPTFKGQTGDNVLRQMRGQTRLPKARFSWDNYPLSKKFMPKHQQRVVADMGEERESVLGDVEAMLAKIPRSQENNDDPIVWAHYFYGQSDWFVIEHHPDQDADYDRFFGFVILNGDSQMAELGYWPVLDLANSNRVELDFYWKPKPLSETKAEADPDMWGKKKEAERVAAPPPTKQEGKIIQLYFPKASKLGDLDEYKEYFWRGYNTERAEVVKEMVFPDAIFRDVADKLLQSMPSMWQDEDGNPVGGSYSDAPELEGKTEQQIFSDKKLAQIYRDTAITNVVKVENKDTGETFYVNTEGYNYARYVGFDKAPEKVDKTPDSPIILPSDCAVTRNMKQNGIEVSFKKQPSETRTAELKAKGFRWSKFQKIWYVKYTEALHKWALEFCAQNEKDGVNLEVPNVGERLITLASVTKAGEVPKKLLRQEIAAGKMEATRYKYPDTHKDSTGYPKVEWVPVSLESKFPEIEKLKNGDANDHWKDSIYLKEDGTVMYGDLLFRYKNSVPGFDYSPNEERSKTVEKQESERKTSSEGTVKVDLVKEKFWIPFNRKAQKGEFAIENPIDPNDIVEVAPFPATAEIDGYKLVGTLTAKNEVTMTMMVLGYGAKQEMRENVLKFTPDSGTVMPNFVSRFLKARRWEEGDKTDFPGWKHTSWPTTLWESMVRAAKEALYEKSKMEEKGKTERGKKIHEGKMKDQLAALALGKRIWLNYEDNNPSVLRRVTGQGDEEYTLMVSKWREELGAPVKKADKMLEDVRTDGDEEKMAHKAAMKNYIDDVKVRINDGDKEMIESIMELGEMSEQEAKRVFDFYVANKVLQRDDYHKTWRPKHGQFLDKDVLRNAIKLSSMLLGKKRKITLPNGEKHDAQYAIVELDSILASHNEETFGDTPGYPKNAAGNNLNDRNYATDKAAQQLVEDYAQNLDPELLISLTSTPDGTPIITENGIVVSGNNRTMSLKLARKKYPEKFKAYQEALRMDLDIFGLDDFDESKNDNLPLSSTMKAPVLVRIDYDFGELTTTNMAKYNASAMKAKSPVDKAVELSTTLREQALCETRIPDILNEFDTLSDFYASVSATQRMVKALQQCSVLNEQDVAAYVDKGLLTEDGKTLLETVLAALILEPNTLRTANRDGVRSLRQAVVNALPALLANKSLPSERTLVPLINAAIEQQANFVASGLSYCDFIMQGNLFGEAETDPRVFALNRLMVSGQKRFRDAITKYTDNQKGQQGASMFADQSVSPQEAFEGFVFKALLPADQECIVNWNKRRTDAPAAQPAPEKTTVPDDMAVLKTRLKLLEKRLPTLEGEQKTIIQTRIKLLRKKTGQ